MIELKSTFNSNFEIGHNPAEKILKPTIFGKVEYFLQISSWNKFH